MKTIVVIVLSIIGMFGALLAYNKYQSSKINLDGFAKCLAEKNVVMYGAYWCPHCKNQKKLFGSSIKYVPYVECTQDTKTCQEKQIKGYPTWIFPDGEKVEGEMSLESLSTKSSCPLP